MTNEKGFFRQVMGHFATGVTVVTTSSQGKLSGLTVNAFSSVSLEPPLVLICVDLISNTLPMLRESQTFAVNMLTDKQEHLSRGFSTNSSERYEHFCYAPYHTVATGAPVIDDVLAFIDARVVAEYPGGDHVIFLGQVEALGIGDQVALASEGFQARSPYTQQNGHLTPDEAHPLVYYEGKYRHLTSKYQKPSLPSTVPYDGDLERQIR